MFSVTGWVETDRNHFFRYGHNRNCRRNYIFSFGRNRNHAETVITVSAITETENVCIYNVDKECLIRGVAEKNLPHTHIISDNWTINLSVIYPCGVCACVCPCKKLKDLRWSWVRFNVPPHYIGHIGDRCLWVKWPDSVKALKEDRVLRIRLQSHQVHPIVSQ